MELAGDGVGHESGLGWGVDVGIFGVVEGVESGGGGERFGC